MLIISHKHYINTISTLLLSVLHDIRAALYFKNISLAAFLGFSHAEIQLHIRQSNLAVAGFECQI